MVRLSRYLPFLRTFFDVSVVSDGADWVLAEEARQISRLVELIGLHLVPYRGIRPEQHIFCTSRGDALNMAVNAGKSLRSRISMAYYHGYPGQGVEDFDWTFAQTILLKNRFFRIQVTHDPMFRYLCEAGVPEEKLQKIVLAVDDSVFFPRTPESCRRARELFGIPQSAVVVGSFQKDGNGWEEGLEPKLIKGPDILCDALERLKQYVPELFVLLSGPARGYVKMRLVKAGIPFVHQFFRHARDVSTCYHATDAYIVAARQEGGPKSILESMASGVPVISTRVGQAPELIENGRNGWLADVEDSEALAHYAKIALSDVEVRRLVTCNGLHTASQNTYAAQVPLWRRFFSVDA